MKVRKSCGAMTGTEWDQFILAFKAMKEGLFKGVAKPTLDDFVDEHKAAFRSKNHDWYVHSHGTHRGLLFLPWHRVFLNEFEKRLQREVPGVTIPYWNAFKSSFPNQLAKISDNEGKNVAMPESLLPDFSQPDFEIFQQDLEDRYHNFVHGELGRTMGRKRSPRDPAFWLHHAFVDRQWGHWFEKHNGKAPPTMAQMLKGDGIVKGVRVQDVLHTTQLDYVYDNGILNTVEQNGAEVSVVRLEKGTIVCARVRPDFYLKIHVFQVTDVAAFLTIQHFPDCKPGFKLGLVPPSTSYCDLIAGKFGVDQVQAHVKVVKSTDATDTHYTIESVNGTRMAMFNGITDFTAESGRGAADYEMLTI